MRSLPALENHLALQGCDLGSGIAQRCRMRCRIPPQRPDLLLGALRPARSPARGLGCLAGSRGRLVPRSGDGVKVPIEFLSSALA